MGVEELLVVDEVELLDGDSALLVVVCEFVPVDELASLDDEVVELGSELDFL